MRRRASKFLADNRLFEFRFLQAMIAHVSGNEERVETIDVWLENYKFSEPMSDGPYGWAPIHFAALEGNLPILSSIFAAGEKVERKTTGHHIEFGAWPDQTPLTIIANFVP